MISYEILARSLELTGYALAIAVALTLLYMLFRR